MKTPLMLNQQYPSFSFTKTPIPFLAKPKPTNSNGFSPLLMRDLNSLRLNLFNLKNPKKYSLVCAKPVGLARTSSPMSEEAKRMENPPPPPVKEAEERRPPVREVPPPPEKPEAGDCCGSGCVRCVWDVYYEELDAYDQLLKQLESRNNNDHNNNNSV